MVQDAAIGRSATAFDPDETLCVVVEMSLDELAGCRARARDPAATSEEDGSR